MKFRFLYVGDKILSHREEGLFRVLNCEEYSLNKKVLDYKEICNRKKSIKMDLVKRSLIGFI